ncbi:MAG TPA: efflux RND transporter periplasmic adaptor subunit [Verrucomicrobiae bacterium]|nr:efflux RND transporter periplasmic adaptor subunit [Verrucomicrobiae bacterium]
MSLSNSKLDALRIERRPERSPGPTLWTAVAVVVVLLGVGGTFWWRSRVDPIAVQTTIARDAMAGAAGGGDHSVLNASGYVTARREATVSSKVTGKVVSILIEEGMKVTNGQILARLDDSNVKAALEVAQAQLLSAQAAVEETRAQLKQANADYERVSELAKRKISSQSDLDQAEATAKSLQAHLDWQETQIEVARSGVDMSRQDLDDMTIRAPFDGVVTTKDAQPGEMISPVSAGGGYTRTGIGTVVDMKSLEVDIDVNENYINRVEAGQAVMATLDAYPDWKIPCKVIAIVPTADRDKSTVKVRVGFNQLDPRILPDMSVKVSFQNENNASGRQAVLVPKSAVREQDGQDVVFVVQDGRAERRAVTVNDTQDDDSILSAGVAPGESVVTNAPAELKDGMAVREEKP